MTSFMQNIEANQDRKIQQLKIVKIIIETNLSLILLFRKGLFLTILKMVDLIQPSILSYNNVIYNIVVVT